MRFILLFFLLALPLRAEDKVGIDDLLDVKSVQGRQAIVRGKTGGLKAGDHVYFVRSPYQFVVESVKGDEAIITLPATHDVSVGNAFLKRPTDMVKKAMEQERRLKSALEE